MRAKLLQTRRYGVTFLSVLIFLSPALRPQFREWIRNGRLRLKTCCQILRHDQCDQNIDLDIEDGEFVVFVGPSGCGKSTLLRMIAGLEDISGGTISIGGSVVNDVAPAKRGVAMVFQTYALYPHMTVYKNMAFGLKQASTPKDEIDKRVRTAADILEISELLIAHHVRFQAGSGSGWPLAGRLCVN